MAPKDGSSLAAEVGEPRDWIYGGRPGVIGGAKRERSLRLQSRDGYWRTAARGVRQGSGIFPFAVGLRSGDLILKKRQTILGYISTKKNLRVICSPHLPSRCIGLSGLGERASTARDSSLLNCNSRVTVSMMA